MWQVVDRYGQPVVAEDALLPLCLLLLCLLLLIGITRKDPRHRARDQQVVEHLGASRCISHVHRQETLLPIAQPSVHRPLGGGTADANHPCLRELEQFLSSGSVECCVDLAGFCLLSIRYSQSEFRVPMKAACRTESRYDEHCFSN